MPSPFQSPPVPFRGTVPRLKLETILFATDFSPASENALRFAVALAHSYKSKLMIAHVIPKASEAVTEHRPSKRALRIRAEAEQRMAEFKEFEPFKGLSHEEIILQGDSWEALEKFIDTHTIDLVVLGTHGRTGLSDLLLGSVAERIFRHSDTPVVTVGPRVRFPHVDSGHIRRVLYATDLTGSQHALPYALSLTKDNKAQFAILHVLQGTAVLPYDVPEQLAEEAKVQMKDLLPAEFEDEAEYIVEMGRPAREILATAMVHNVDIIVMGVHPAPEGTASHAPWAVAHQVVGRAPCPVLTVRS